MLFNSIEFLFGFLPVAFGVYWALMRWERARLGEVWLVMTSLFFYGWWNIRFLPVILVSIGFNFCMGHLLLRDASESARGRGLIAAAGIVVDLTILVVYKYGAFFAIPRLELPLGISFFTFTQIAYLADCYSRKIRHPYGLNTYAFFVTYFPHLIAGPIVHNKEMTEQLKAHRKPGAQEISVGLTILVLGLFKKVIIADSLAPFATAVFDAAGSHAPGFQGAWMGTLAYTFQLYFDFSAYSDMAIGLGYLFGIRLPLNFNSPYKAASLIDFWSRWHISLSRFLRDYLYIPLGGNRRGQLRRHVNLMLTMLLGGLWHGTGWTFIVWGGLHGIYLIVNHRWRALGIAPSRSPIGRHAFTLAARAVTFLAVVVGWVFFRARDLKTAGAILGAMASPAARTPASASAWAWSWIAAAALLAWFAPNVQELMADFNPALVSREPQTARARWAWRPDPRLAFLVALLALICIVSLQQASEFLYFQF